MKIQILTYIYFLSSTTSSANLNVLIDVCFGDKQPVCYSGSHYAMDAFVLNSGIPVIRSENFQTYKCGGYIISQEDLIMKMPDLSLFEPYRCILVYADGIYLDQELELISSEAQKHALDVLLTDVTRFRNQCRMKVISLSDRDTHYLPVKFNCVEGLMENLIAHQSNGSIKDTKNINPTSDRVDNRKIVDAVQSSDQLESCWNLTKHILEEAKGIGQTNLETTNEIPMEETCLQLVKNYAKMENNKIDSKDIVLRHMNNFALKPWLPFLGEGLKILTFIYPPFTVQDNHGQLQGVEIYLVKYLCNNKNIEFIVHNSTDWTGSLNGLRNGTGDISVCGHWWNAIIKEDLDFSYPIFKVSSTFLVPRGIPLPEATYLFQPFTFITWLVVFLLTIVVTKCVQWIATLKSENMTFADVTMITLSVLVLNNCNHSFKSCVLKMCIITWSFASLLLYTGYSAGFASIGAIPRYKDVIRSFSDSYEHEFSCYSAFGALSDTLRQSDNKYVKAFASKIVYGNSKANFSCYPVDVIYEKYVVDGYNITNYGKYRKLNEYYLEPYIVMALRKNSPYTKMFDIKILRLHETGMLKYWFEHVQYKYKYQDIVAMQDVFRTHRNTGQVRVATTLNETQAAFYFLLLGYLCSGICYLWEKYVYYFEYK